MFLKVMFSKAWFYFPLGSIPDEAKALSLLAPANAVAGILPGGGLLPTPNPLPSTAVSLQTRWYNFSDHCFTTKTKLMSVPLCNTFDPDLTKSNDQSSQIHLEVHFCLVLLYKLENVGGNE